MTNQPIKLNLGSGDNLLPDYINLDGKFGDSLFPIRCARYAQTYASEDLAVDEIRASHVLEHFPHGQVLDVLKHWVSKLKAGGTLKIAVPDFGKLARDYAAGKPDNYTGYLMGGQTDERDFHRALFDEASLKYLLAQAGLTDIQPWQSDARDCASLPVSLNLMGTKPFEEGAIQEGAMVQGIPVAQLQPAIDALKRRVRNVYSQFGEDGILEALFGALGAENQWCLEVGAGDGIFFSNTRRLVEQGWHALLIEKDADGFERLRQNTTATCVCENVEVGPHATLDTLLAKHGAPVEIDLVSIDVDGQDWHVCNAMLQYRPRVLIVEYAMEGNARLYRGPEFIPTLNGEGQAGCIAVQRLLCGKGYVPVAITASNVIAVRGDLTARLLTLGSPQQTHQPQAVSPAERPPTVDDKPVVIRAVMSMPRLAFSDNMFCGVGQLCMALGINLEKGSGVFWDQVLTRMIESHLHDGTDFVLTVDYDTWFRKEHVIRLCQLMVEHPEVDAIVPLQVKRENDVVLFGKFDADGKPVERVPINEFRRDLTPIVNGHFGLTVFRVASFARLKKPWFLGVPDPNGGWDDGRTDPDIYFWQNFYRSGLKACLAPNIKIVHLQQVGTAPGPLEETWKPVHCYLTDLEKGIVPPGIIPTVELRS